MAMIDVAEAKNARRAGIGATDTMASAGGIVPWHQSSAAAGRAVVNASGDRTAVLEGRGHTAGEFIRAAGLDWTVSKRPLFLADGTAVESHNAVVRDSDGAQLAVVLQTYPLVQNVDAFATMDTFVQAGYGTFETAGSLWNGRTVYVTIRVNDDFEVVEGDRVESYLVFWNRHGKGAACAKRTDIRPVCGNTLRAAKREGETIWSLRHVGDVAAALKSAAEKYLEVRERAMKTRELYRAMAKISVDTAETREFILRAITPKKSQSEQEREADDIYEHLGIDTSAAVSESARAEARRELQVKAIMDLVDCGKGSDIPGVRGTLWGVYNAVTEYGSHHYPTRGVDRTQSVMVGAAGELLDRAIETAASMARVA